MNTPLRFIPAWDRISQSLWFIPALLTLLAAIGAYVSVELDRNVWNLELARSFWFVFDIGGEGARSTLSAIAQSLITVTGVVFSVTIVALQLAASQFTPRVLRTFLSDRGNQVVLGIFIATFTYTLLVERTVGTPFGSETAFVPSISVTIAIVLTLISIGALIYFIDHVAQSIRASIIISHVTDDGRNLIEGLFPEQVGGAERQAAENVALPDDAEHLRVVCVKGGYLQAVDEDALFDVADEGKAVIRMEPPMGRYVLPGEVLASVWFDDGRTDEDRSDQIEEKVREAFVLGEHWTLGQDFERALVELTDIAVRALSPGINDPTTASQCVDRLGDLLVLLGNREMPDRLRMNSSRQVRFIARRLRWERAVQVAFENIRHYGSSSPAVALRMIEVCGRVRAQVPRNRRPALEEQISDVVEAAKSSITLESDRERVLLAAEIALRPIPEGVGQTATRV